MCQDRCNNDNCGLLSPFLVLCNNHSTLRATRYCPHVTDRGTGPSERGVTRGKSRLAQPRDGHRGLSLSFSEIFPSQRGSPCHGSPTCISNSSFWVHMALSSERTMQDTDSPLPDRATEISMPSGPLCHSHLPRASPLHPNVSIISTHPTKGTSKSTGWKRS